MVVRTIGGQIYRKLFLLFRRLLLTFSALYNIKFTLL